MTFFSELSNPVLAYTVSAILTMAIHSSSIMSGMIVILAMGGIIPLEVAVPMILGANLGSSITVLIASSKLNLYAKRAGVANFLFNLFGTLLFMIFLPSFTSFMQWVVNDPAKQTALSHLFFNLFTTLFFLILLKPFERLVNRLVKGQEEEILFETKYIQNNGDRKLQERMGDIKKELAYSIENTVKIYQKAISTFYNPSKSTIMEIQKLETLNDFLDDEITQSIVSLSKYRLSQKDAQESVTLVKISNIIEQLGDLGNDFSKVFERMYSLNIRSKDVDIEKLTDIHNGLIGLFKDIEEIIQKPEEGQLLALKQEEEKIYAQIREEFDMHVHKLQEEKEYNGSIFVDAVSIIELSVSKVRDIRKLLLRQVREFPSE